MGKLARLFAAAAILLVSLWIIPSSCVTQADVKDICSQTRNPSFCLSFLESIPFVRTAKLSDLCLTTINTAASNAARTSELIQKLLKQTTDPHQKQSLSSCSYNYDEAIKDLKDARNDIIAGDFEGANVAASGALDGATQCQELLGTTEPPLQKNNQVVGDCCSIILVISNLLPR